MNAEGRKAGMEGWDDKNQAEVVFRVHGGGVAVRRVPGATVFGGRGVSG